MFYEYRTFTWMSLVLMFRRLKRLAEMAWHRNMKTWLTTVCMTGTISVLYLINSSSEVDYKRLKIEYRRYLSEYMLLPRCKWPPKTLVKRQNITLDSMDFEDLENMFPYMKYGRSKPKNCKSEQRIAVIVPYRDRLPQLKIFLLNLIPFLHRQNADFTIFIVEQSSAGSRFNRGMMRNIGFLEANLKERYDCYIFHDVDVLPEDDRNRYTCGKMPRHLSGRMDRHNYTLLYRGLVGGITAMRYNHFININGYSNQFFVWGGEDDDLYRRTKINNYTIDRPTLKYSYCTSVSHKKSRKEKERLDIINSISEIWREDGLNSVKYEQKLKEYRKLYIWLYVTIDEQQIIKERLLNPKIKDKKDRPANLAILKGMYNKQVKNVIQQ